MNIEDRRGIVGAAIAITIALLVVVIGIVATGDGDTVDLASRNETDRPEASLVPDAPDAPEPPDEPAPNQPSTPTPVPEDPSQPPEETPSSIDPPPVETTTPPEADVPLRPGEGVEVTTAQSLQTVDWVPAEIYAALLRELGYQVSDPSEIIEPARELYPAMAEGSVDYWANGRFPLEQPLLDQPANDGVLGDLIAATGLAMEDGSRLGLAIDRETADANEIRSVEQLVSTPELSALFDRDGNGRADLVMCDNGPRCGELKEVLGSTGIAEDVDVAPGSYLDEMYRVVSDQVAGDPVFFAHHEPFWTAGTMLIGFEIVWLPFEAADVAGEIELEPGECAGEPCRLGVEFDDITAVANQCFLDENPAATSLLESIVLDPFEISILHRDTTEGSDPFSLSAIWIEENRGDVDGWLATAREHAAVTEPQPCDGGGGATSPA